jgi:hypothetical protein
MVHHITNVIKEYQDRLREIPYVPKTSYRRESLGYSRDANKNFLTFLFSDQATAIQFLKDVGLIRSKTQCNSCRRDMTSYADPNVLHGFRSRCRRMVAGTRCSGSHDLCSGSRSVGHARAVTRHSATSVTFAATLPNIGDDCGARRHFWSTIMQSFLLYLRKPCAVIQHSHPCPRVITFV